MAPDPNSPVPAAPKKPRAKRAEFGLAALLMVVSALLYVYGHPEAAALLAAVAAGSAGKGFLPSKPQPPGNAMLLFALLTISFGAGCTSEGYVRVEAIEPAVKLIVERHDRMLDSLKAHEKTTQVLPAGTTLFVTPPPVEYPTIGQSIATEAKIDLKKVDSYKLTSELLLKTLNEAKPKAPK